MNRALTVLEDLKFRISQENPTATDKLKAIKVINGMKIKRSSKKGAIKESYNQIIKSLEADYEG